MLEVAAGGRLGQRRLLELGAQQLAFERPHAWEVVDRRREPPLRLVEQVVRGTDGRHRKLLGRSRRWFRRLWWISLVTPIL
jgi:hypothetical protein